MKTPVRIEHPRLTVEAIPTTTMFSNLRNILSKRTWDYLRRRVYREAGYHCEVCGGQGEMYPVSCHEVFSYCLTTRIQTLVRCVALCPACHEVKHIGLAQMKGHLDRAMRHLKKVNRWTMSQSILYFDEYMVWYRRASMREWRLSLAGLRRYGLYPEKYKKAIIKSRHEGYEKTQELIENASY